jgi:hypothetical protein
MLATEINFEFLSDGKVCWAGNTQQGRPNMFL